MFCGLPVPLIVLGVPRLEKTLTCIQRSFQAVVNSRPAEAERSLLSLEGHCEYMRVAVLIHYGSAVADLDGWDESETRCSAALEKNRWELFVRVSHWIRCNENQVRHQGAEEQSAVTVPRPVRSCVHSACTIVLRLVCSCGPVVALNNHSAGVSVLLLLGKPPPPSIFCSLVLSPFILSLSCHFNNHTVVCEAPSASTPYSWTLFTPCNFFLLWLQLTAIKHLEMWVVQTLLCSAK